RYGVVPIVRRVGGLADTVDDGVTGFVFEPYTSESLIGATIRGLDVYWNPSEWDRMRRAAMARDFSWDRSARSYLEVYRQVVAERCETAGAAGG
ncbi:MAG: starch synthase, partial [Gemmatimonadales bacterium]